MNSPKDEAERAEQAARIRERAAKTRLMHDENGNLVKHRQADDGRWLPVEKSQPAPARNRPVQISTARDASTSHVRTYMALGAFAIVVAIGLLVGLPMLGEEPEPVPEAKPAAPPPLERSVVLVEVPVGTNGAGFVVAPGQLVTEAATIDRCLASEVLLRFPDGSTRLGARPCRLLWRDAALGLAVLGFEGVEAPLPLFEGELPPAGAPLRFLNPGVDRLHDGVAVLRTEGFLGEQVLKDSHSYRHLSFERMTELPGTPVVTLGGDVLGLLRAGAGGEANMLVPALELTEMLQRAKRLGPAAARQAEALHDAEVLSERLIFAAEKYGMAAMAIGLTLQKYHQRGEALEMGLQEALAALSASVLEADELFERANAQRVQDLTGRPELGHDVRALLLQLQREVAELRERVHRPRGTVQNYAQDSKRSIRKIDEVQSELTSLLRG